MKKINGTDNIKDNFIKNVSDHNKSSNNYNKNEQKYFVFFKIKNKKLFFKELEELIKAFYLNFLYTNEYMKIKEIKILLMKKVEKNLKEINNLLIQLKEVLPLKEKDIKEILLRDFEEKIEKHKEKIKEIQSKDQENKDVKELEKLKKELQELEEKLLELMIEE